MYISSPTIYCHSHLLDDTTREEPIIPCRLHPVLDRVGRAEFAVLRPSDRRPRDRAVKRGGRLEDERAAVNHVGLGIADHRLAVDDLDVEYDAQTRTMTLVYSATTSYGLITRKEVLGYGIR